MNVIRQLLQARSIAAVSLVATVLLTASCKKTEGTTGGGSKAGANSCPTPGNVLLEGPKICVKTPDGYVKPLSLDNSKTPQSGNVNVSYSEDGTVGGKFVATFTVTYNPPATAGDFKTLEQDASSYCDSPPSLESIAGGKGKYFSCKSTKLDGNTLAKSTTYSDKNTITCSSQSKAKPDVDDVCKTLQQL